MAGALTRHAISEEAIKNIDPKLHFGDKKALTVLLEAGITPEELKDLNIDLRHLFIVNAHEVRILLKAVSFDELKSLDPSTAHFFLTHAHTIFTLLKSGLSWDELKNMNPKKRRQVLGAL
jgi:hypothetical protein